MPADITAIFPAPQRAESRLRKSLRLILIAWIFGAFWQWTINGAAMTRFARGLNTPDWAFGLLAMIPPLAGLLQLPASILLERFGRRRMVFLVAMSISRATWVIIASIPWVFPNAQAIWWPLMLVAVLISWSGAHLAVPAWMNWMADVVPASLRGRYFGKRNRVGQIVGVITTLGIGFLLDAADKLGASTGIDAGRLMLMTTSVLIAIGGLVGVLDVQCFARVPNAESPPGQAEIRWGEFLLRPLKDKSFRFYLAFNFFLAMGIGSMGQYLWLYLFDVIQVSNQTANMMLIALPLVCFAITFPLWGRLIDRVGCRPVLLICAVLSSLGPLAWVTIQPEWIWPSYMLVLLTILIWPGVEIANFNLLLGIAGSGKGGGAYVACSAMAGGLGGIVSGLMATCLAAWFVDLHWKIPGVPVVATYHTLIFFSAFTVRFLAVPLALGIKEPKAHHTQQVIKYMSSSLYSNIRTYIMLPNRLMSQMVRRTYK